MRNIEIMSLKQDGNFIVFTGEDSEGTKFTGRLTISKLPKRGQRNKERIKWRKV